MEDITSFGHVPPTPSRVPRSLTGCREDCFRPGEGAGIGSSVQTFRPWSTHASVHKGEEGTVSLSDTCCHPVRRGSVQGDPTRRVGPKPEGTDVVGVVDGDREFYVLKGVSDRRSRLNPLHNVGTQVTPRHNRYHNHDRDGSPQPHRHTPPLAAGSDYLG